MPRPSPLFIARQHARRAARHGALRRGTRRERADV